jgi:hypothetical protein
MLQGQDTGGVCTFDFASVSMAHGCAVFIHLSGMLGHS